MCNFEQNSTDDCFQNIYLYFIPLLNQLTSLSRIWKVNSDWRRGGIQFGAREAASFTVRSTPDFWNTN